MPNERDLTATHPELDGGEFLENDSFFEERLPERQYCVFRAGRERWDGLLGQSRQDNTGQLDRRVRRRWI